MRSKQVTELYKAYTAYSRYLCKPDLRVWYTTELTYRHVQIVYLHKEYVNYRNIRPLCNFIYVGREAWIVLSFTTVIAKDLCRHLRTRT